MEMLITDEEVFSRPFILAALQAEADNLAELKRDALKEFARQIRLLKALVRKEMS